MRFPQKATGWLLMALLTLAGGAAGWFWLGCRVPREVPPINAQDAWEQAGARFLGKEEQSREYLPTFELRAWPADGLRTLPTPATRFGLVLTGVELTDARAEELASLKNVVLFLEDRQVTDEVLRALRQAGGLHLLSRARADDGSRPTRAEEVRTLDLIGTKVTDRGLAELAPLVNLRSLFLPNSVTDGTLKVLRQVRLLHTVPLALDRDGRQPSRMEEITTLSLRATQVTAAGLEELAGLTKLRTLSLKPEQITDETLRILHKVGLLHTLSQASAPGGKRPTRPDAVTRLDLRQTLVTARGLHQLSGLKRLDTLVLFGRQVTDETLVALETIGLLHALDRCSAREGKRPTRPEQVVALHLGGTRVQGAGLKALTALTHLETLDLRETDVVETELAALAPLKRLTWLALSPERLTNGALRALRHADLLHALDRATTADGQRPTKAERVCRLDLTHTRVTATGLLELVPLKRLTHLALSEAQITDETLRALREIQLFHTLDLAEAPGGKRPTTPAEVVRLRLCPTRVTEAGLKYLSGLANLAELSLGRKVRVTDVGARELAGLKKLTTLSLPSVQLTDGALRALRQAGLLHVLSRATAEGGKRPGKADEVVSVDLSLDRQVTARGLEELAGFKRLTTLALPEVTDEAVTTLEKIGLVHALDRARAAGGKRPTRAADVVTLELRGTAVTAAGLRAFRGLRNLTSVSLFSDQVTDEVLESLRQIGFLHLLDHQTWARGDQRAVRPEDVLHVNLDGTQVTDRGLAALTALPNLARLTLRHTRVTDQGLVSLTPLKKLTSLDLEGTAISDEGLKRLAPLSHLETLRLYGTKVTDAGLKHLKALNQLTTLDLYGRELTDASLQALSEAGLLHTLPGATTANGQRPGGEANVHTLNLYGQARVSDAGLVHLRALKNLTTLHLHETQVTDRGVNDLTRALPRCRIDR